MVVDDNKFNCELMERWLRRSGHTAVMAEGGKQALEKMGEKKFDLVLLDLMMPDINGLKILKQWKADEGTRHIPVIILSAYEEHEAAVQCIEAGAEDYLSKPFNHARLKARINACLRKTSQNK